MNNTPFISVMILCYNYEKTLRKALDACAQQSFRDFEIVMINNGSTDNSENVYRLFCEENPQIRTTYVPVFPNEGPIHGWNIGIQRANGEYVMFNDADDWMEPECLEKLANKAKETGSDRIIGPYQEVNNEGEVLRVRSVISDKLKLPTAMLQGTIFRRSVIIEQQLMIPEQPYVPAYDWWMTLHFAAREKNPGVPVIGNNAIYNYYINPISEVTKAQNAADFNADLEKWAYPVLTITAEARQETQDSAIRNQMEYLAIRHYYAFTLAHFRTLNKQEAKQFYNALHKEITAKLPKYLKNPYLKLRNNGYDQPATAVCRMLSFAERMHMMGTVRIAVRRMRNAKALGVR